MKYSDIINFIIESNTDQFTDYVNDMLMNLHIQGVNSIPTETLLKSFENEHVLISVDQLIDLLKDNPLIKDANHDTVTFDNSEEHDIIDNDSDNGVDTVSQMAQHALNKRLKD